MEDDDVAGPKLLRRQWNKDLDNAFNIEGTKKKGPQLGPLQCYERKKRW